MGSFTNNEKSRTTEEKAHEVAAVIVPFPAQSHLNQLLQLSCLISSYGLPVHYVGSALHIQQVKSRARGSDPLHTPKIHFHDIPTPPFVSPPPDPNSSDKFPVHLPPAWIAMLNLRAPVGAYLKEMSEKFKRVVVVHDLLMAAVVQDAASIPNAESYAVNCVSALSWTISIWDGLGRPFPVQHSKELPSAEGFVPDEVQQFVALQSEPLSHRSGDIYTTCRVIEGPYLDLLEREELRGNRKIWAIGPILPAKSSPAFEAESQNRCLQWLDKQEPSSVIYVSFGTTISLSDDQIKELALGLEQSKTKFLWVLRDADRANIFEGEFRRAELPEGFEERVEEFGMVVRDWAPQLEILSHQSTGGFMSHCGWNSCMESITHGVTIAAWPMHSDQPSNTFLITEVLKVGLLVRPWKYKKDELVEASTIKNAVVRLMASEEGDEVRKRAKELGASVRQAIEQGGVSRLELDSFIAHVTR